MARISESERAERDARITIMLVQGMTWDSIAAELSTSKQVVSEVAQRLKRAGYDAQGAAEKRDRFIQSVENFGVAYMDMLRSQAELLSDVAYISKQTTTDVIAHSEFVSRSFERVVRLQRAVSTPEGAAALPERVEAELVDA